MNAELRAHHLAEILAAEESVRDATRRALNAWLPEVLAAVVEGEAPKVKLHTTEPPAVKPLLASVGEGKINANAAENTRASWAEHAKRILEAIGAIWTARHVATGAPDTVLARRREVFLARVRSRLFAVPDVVFRRLTQLVFDATHDGLDVQTLARRIREELASDNKIYADRAEVIARTEAISAYNAGAQDGYADLAKAAGTPMNKRWLAIDDSHTRASHREANDQTVPADAKFEVGGFPAEFPGDPELPAEEAIQCRCIAVYGLPSELSIIAASGRMDPMPWHVTHGAGCPADKPYAVVKDATGETVSCHDTQEKAAAAVRALYANDKAAAGELPNGWRGPMAALDVPTGDTRILNTPPGGVRSREYPMSFTREHVTEGVDKFIGTLDAFWVQDGMLWGEGSFDLTGADGVDAAKLLLAGLHTVSIQPDQVTFEQRFYRAPGGNAYENLVEVSPAEAINAAGDALNPGYVAKDVMSDWRLASVAMVSIPAYDEARILPVYDYVRPGTAPEPAVDAPVAESAPQPNFSGSSMIAVHPRNPHLYALEGGTAAEDLHITLHYLGDVANLTDASAIAKANHAAKVAATVIDGGGDHTVTVSGYGVLGDKGAVVLFLNSPALAAAHAASSQELAEYSDHYPIPHEPYTAHMTLGYGVDLAEAARYVGEEIQLGSAAFHYGPDRSSYCIGCPLSAQNIIHNPNGAPYAIVAAGGGQTFKSESFMVEADGPTAFTTVHEPDGRVRVLGHVALWGSCYMAFGGGSNKPCITTPYSSTEYSRFHVHGARLEDGSILPVGAITFGDGHRSAGGLRASSKLYADIATMACKVRAVEDQWGVFVCGEVLDQFKDRADDLLLSPLSGHWEPDGDARGGLEMLAAHVVTTPGYKVPRIVASLGEDGEYDAVQIAGPWDGPDTIAAMDDSLVATVTGSVGLPVADSGTAWDGSKASQRVFAHFTSNGKVNAAGVARAFLWRDPNGDPQQVGSYKLGFADVVGGKLTIVPRGVSAAAGRLNQTQIPADEKAAVQRKITSLYAKIKKTDKNWPDSPFSNPQTAILAAVRADRQAQRALVRLGVDAQSRAAAALDRLKS